ncbi:MAG: hypothetical protein LBB40_01385 [Holophagales bacterium]|nr:hypothetical protein [Holophagales bacterium]
MRDTNAPFALVREALLNGQNYRLWHPRHRSVSPEIIEDGERLEILCRIRGLGVYEEARYFVEPTDGRLLLTYQNRFSGWPVIILMGWWRIRSEHIWERFIASLP